MSEQPKYNAGREGADFRQEVRRQEDRKLKAQRRGTPSIWFGLGMIGLVGWSVAVPTLLGAGLGMWLDRHYPMPHSWTLTLLIGGLVLGCLNAWRWVSKEEKALRDENDDDSN